MAEAKGPQLNPPVQPQPPAPLPASAPADAPPPAAPAPNAPITGTDRTQQQIVHSTGGSYHDGRLTLAGMRQAIAAGGSVLIHQKDKDGNVVDSRIHTSVHTLPTAADLAQTPEEKDAARKQLEAEQRRIQEQLNALKSK